MIFSTLPSPGERAAFLQYGQQVQMDGLPPLQAVTRGLALHEGVDIGKSGARSVRIVSAACGEPSPLIGITATSSGALQERTRYCSSQV